MRRWTKDHGDDGLRNPSKFSVFKTKDAVQMVAATVVPNGALLGADGEFFFVLRPETDEEATMALAYYARVVRHRAPQLHNELLVKLRDIAAANDQHATAVLMNGAVAESLR